ncbi:hypothetical protein Mapa_012132 [Marchantia paleacea]|nr:hypothetical protein Mapa_012132 [Marchantia paleacea]
MGPGPDRGRGVQGERKSATPRQEEDAAAAAVFYAQYNSVLHLPPGLLGPGFIAFCLSVHSSSLTVSCCCSEKNNNLLQSSRNQIGFRFRIISNLVTTAIG